MIALIATFLIAGQEPTAWLVSEQRSRLTGEVSYTTGIESSEPMIGPAGRRATAMLALTCNDGRRRVAVSWPTYLGQDGTDIQWRFDQGQVESRSVEVLNGGSTFVLEGAAAEAFMDRVAAAGEVVVGAVAYRDRQEAVFRLAGGSDAVAGVRRACPGR